MLSIHGVNETQTHLPPPAGAHFSLLLSFYPLRHLPFIKQVHSPPLTTILPAKEASPGILGDANRKK
ncbi:hypothetical protein F1652_09010 [Pluralibacter gergoviae]|nr:hypothetical protein [Pluralibacter gergoviae]